MGWWIDEMVYIREIDLGSRWIHPHANGEFENLGMDKEGGEYVVDGVSLLWYMIYKTWVMSYKKVGYEMWDYVYVYEGTWKYEIRVAVGFIDVHV